MAPPAFDLSLYLVTDSALLPPGVSLLSQVEAAIRRGVTIVQLREKKLDTREFVALAQSLIPICRSNGVPLLINDRLDVALATGADGVHVGQSDMPVRIVIVALKLIRERTPLVHTITNYVAMNGKGCSSLFDSPLMATDKNEAAAIVSFCDSLVLNIGTLEPFTEGMKVAAAKASTLSTPIVLDPVAVVTIIRGNGGEIAAVASQQEVQCRGVDSVGVVENPEKIVQGLAKQKGVVVAMTGKPDYVSDGRRLARVHNKSRYLPMITASGCMVAALTSAFAAVFKDVPFVAAVGALVAMGVASEMAETGHSGLSPLKVNGPGTFRIALFDENFHLDGDTIKRTARSAPTLTPSSAGGRERRGITRKQTFQAAARPQLLQMDQPNWKSEEIDVPSLTSPGLDRSRLLEADDGVSVDDLSGDPTSNTVEFVDPPSSAIYRCRSCGKIPMKAFGETSSTQPTCEDCNTRISYPPHAAFQTLLDELVVFCPNRAKGCQTSSPRGRMDGHLDNECMFAMVACDNSDFGCSFRVLRQDIPTDAPRGAVHQCPFEISRSAVTSAVKKFNATSQRLLLHLDLLTNRVEQLEKSTESAGRAHLAPAARPTQMSYASSMVTEAELEALSQRIVQLERVVTENAPSSSASESDVPDVTVEQTPTVTPDHIERRLTKLERIIETIADHVSSRVLEVSSGPPVGYEREQKEVIHFTSPSIQPSIPLCTRSLLDVLRMICLSSTVTSCTLQWSVPGGFKSPDDVGTHLITPLARAMATNESLVDFNLSLSMDTKSITDARAASPDTTLNRSLRQSVSAPPPLQVTREHMELLIKFHGCNLNSKMKSVALFGFSLEREAHDVISTARDSNPTFPIIMVSERRKSLAAPLPSSTVVIPVRLSVSRGGSAAPSFIASVPEDDVGGGRASPVTLAQNTVVSLGSDRAHTTSEFSVGSQESAARKPRVQSVPVDTNDLHLLPEEPPRPRRRTDGERSNSKSASHDAPSRDAHSSDSVAERESQPNTSAGTLPKGKASSNYIPPMSSTRRMSILGNTRASGGSFMIGDAVPAGPIIRRKE
ncbi:HK-domain-containing protein [Gonapodya prolifera JEL478]|uniref:hydroxyethylthiazole kinase n=1 Tax=Gonapodya prolifera (strain JEL478) TaxID=1344416 RepID=A0A139AQS8_GONPJ|nr:HK-domain-containing protein [Gonapodya prolifera JEL478]|eukprot:KXS18845.1 HK-domain-containing protein [Gonapodya prolifera JEL478]